MFLLLQKQMGLGYDPKKNAWNIQERGLSFDDVATLDWTTAAIRQDKRQDYGEVKYQAFIEDADAKSYVVVFTVRGEVFGSSASAAPTSGRGKAMARKPDPTMIDEENPEWTREAAAEARPFVEIFPEQFSALKNKGGRPPIEQPKMHIGFRLAADVVKGVRAAGPGYNARVEKVLREALESGRF